MSGVAVAEQTRIGPQPGKQESFCYTPADIAIYGGKAYSAKTFGLLLQPLLHSDQPNFRAVLFARTYGEIMGPSGMWEQAGKIYPYAGARAIPSRYEYVFPSGAKVCFRHMEHDNDRFHYKTQRIPFIGFDQAEMFGWAPVWFLCGRAGDPSGENHSYVRMTCNPDPNSWLREFLSWWIDEDTGFAIEERGGVIRWFVMDGNSPTWASTRAELAQWYDPEEQPPMSVTFIPASMEDNPLGIKADPGYVRWLKNLPLVERERMLKGNWNIRETAGNIFRREWLPVVPAAPAGGRFMRGWDLGASKKSETTGTGKIQEVEVGGLRRYYIHEAVRFQATAGEAEMAIKARASQDGVFCELAIPNDPGQAGNHQVEYLAGQLAGCVVHFRSESGDKVARARPLSSQAQAGNVYLVDGPWVKPFLDRAENFGYDERGKAMSVHEIDALTQAFMELTQPVLVGGAW